MRALSALACCTATSVLSLSAGAVTTLSVDLSKPIGPVTHAASGSLYGVTETLPADVTGLIAPLHPRMFTNPAADQQQPVGDAIVVAGRVAPTGAMVTIRLADWLKGFYTFTSMTDWLDKIGQTVARKKAAGLTNVYAYEIWNEPSGTYASSNPLSFNEFWRQTFVQLRSLDPDVKITGPSLSYYDETYLKNFLSFCKTNSCLPDIVGWHELGGGNLTSDLQRYRTLEGQLGIGPLPITINEYSGANHIDVEGQPGASAPLIAKFERFSVDSACISFWDVPHPGRLGSLLATNTDPNGGWWFYKWYGDMAGNMVSTTPPTPSSATALDGFANLDSAGRTATVLVGGVNDGSIQVSVTGFSAASFFGPSVHAVVEHTPFVNRTTVVKATDTLSTADVAVMNDQLSVTISNAKSTDGYRLTLTPTGGGTGGAAGSAGASGSAGTSGAAGASAGSSAMAGAAGSGGRDGAGGRGDAGAGMSGRAQGGQGGAGGGSGGHAEGGQGGQGGAVSSGGALVAGKGGAPDASGAAGATSARGGNAGVAGAPKTSRGGSGAATGERESGGCSCRIGRSPLERTGHGFLILSLLALSGRRRRRTTG